MIPRINPRKLEPQSPMKVEAGGKLKKRKPRDAPARATLIKAIEGLPWIKFKAAKNIADIAETPAVTPSA